MLWINLAASAIRAALAGWVRRIVFFARRLAGRAGR